MPICLASRVSTEVAGPTGKLWPLLSTLSSSTLLLLALFLDVWHVPDTLPLPRFPFLACSQPKDTLELLPLALLSHVYSLDLLLCKGHSEKLLHFSKGPGSTLLAVSLALHASSLTPSLVPALSCCFVTYRSQIWGLAWALDH